MLGLIIKLVLQAFLVGYNLVIIKILYIRAKYHDPQLPVSRVILNYGKSWKIINKKKGISAYTLKNRSRNCPNLLLSSVSLPMDRNI
jgi:hypothetical protein